MFYFVNYLRTIAAILITNSHFSNIWPVSAMATGGLLGNVLFFAISGFCLFNVKENFGKWYLKRILRVYPTLIAFTLLTVLMGDYSLKSGADAVRLFVYPTNYVFLVWLMVLYIAFYVVAWSTKKNDKFLPIIFALVLFAWLVVYILFVDKTQYVVDEVSKPYILFLYFMSMLIGAMFRKRVDKIKETKLSHVNVIMLFLTLVIYFGCKIIFSRIQKLAFLQLLNQLSIMAVLYFTFAVFIRLEKNLARLPTWLNKPMKFLSSITLQIYIVQFVVINKLSNIVFPLNLLLVVIGIVVLATVVYYVECFIKKSVARLLSKTKGRKKYEDSKD